MHSTVGPGGVLRNTALFLLIFFFCSSVARADEIEKRNAGHFPTAHKLLIVAGAVLVLSALANSAASVHCQHEHPSCREGNPFLPAHPSNGAIYGMKLGSTVAFIGVDRWIVHRNRLREQDPFRFAWLFWMPALSYANIAAASRTAGYSPNIALATARSRLMQNAPTH